VRIGCDSEAQSTTGEGAAHGLEVVQIFFMGCPAIVVQLA